MQLTENPSGIAVPRAGLELGKAVSTTNFVINAALAAYTGLSVPVVIPPNTNIFVEAELPAITMGATATSVAMEILRDGTQIGAVLLSFPANQNGPVRCSVSETPTAGPHVYSVSVQTGVASVTTTSNAGPAVFGLYAVFPYIRVVTC